MARVIQAGALDRWLRAIPIVLCSWFATGCVSTEALYAEYDAIDCVLVAEHTDSGKMQLHEQTTNTHYPWEPAVYFEFDSSELSDAEIARLQRSMQVVKAFPSLSLGLQGFTDKRGSLTYNRALADRRVNAVLAYLVANGIDKSRVHLQPIGEVLPRSGDTVSESMATNRRVELMLLQTNGRPQPVEYAMKPE